MDANQAFGRGGLPPQRGSKATGEQVQRLIAALALTKDGTPEARAAAATREVAMLAGAVFIARASDGLTARSVLDACRL